MREIYYVFASIVLSLLLALQGYTVINLFKEKEKEQPPSVCKTSPTYKVTIKGDEKLAEELLKKGFLLSYKNGNIEITFKNPQKLLKVLSIYSEYKANKKRFLEISFAVKTLIEEDIKLVRKELSRLLAEYNELKGLLLSRGIKVNLSPFYEDIAQLQREVYKSYTSYWDKKIDQLLNGFKNLTDEPFVDTKKILQKGATFYGNDLKYRVFRLYVTIKVYESRLTADLVKYREYGLEGGD
ncbi:MAG: hypothetical protein DSZ31_05325 [Gammaproteobacteria bacterium]|nr:MAG: hypothetical protein DSZ31_05325 [Gammaproteobacteria bacterium]RTZ69977.1 MAG: hypothetical protein DSZ30_01525 [Aquificaceae bacterium]